MYSLGKIPVTEIPVTGRCEKTDFQIPSELDAKKIALGWRINFFISSGRGVTHTKRTRNHPRWNVTDTVILAVELLELGERPVCHHRPPSVRPWDPVMLASATLALRLAPLLASALPALRAAGVEPMVALRNK